MSTYPLHLSFGRAFTSSTLMSLLHRIVVFFTILWGLFNISFSDSFPMTHAYLIPFHKPLSSSFRVGSSSSPFHISYPPSSSRCSHRPMLIPSLAGLTSKERRYRTRNQLLTQIGELKAGLEDQGVETQLVKPISKFMGEIDLPGSKSLSNRILLLASLCEGETLIENLLESEDIEYMVKALDLLNVKVEKVKESSKYEASEWKVVGNGKPFQGSTDKDKPLELFLGNAGTAMRPLSAVLCGGEGSFLLDGVPRMRERPIQDLIDGLRQLDIDISCSDTGCPPVAINGNGIEGGHMSISGKISSQYLSSILMAAPLAKKDITVEIFDELVSAPYVHLTMKLMKKFGVTVESKDDKLFTVKGGQKYVSPGKIFTEGDASSASYFLAGAALTGGIVTVRGCGSESVQGDIYFAEVLEKMGCKLIWSANSMTLIGPDREAGELLKGIDVDCGTIPDAAMTLATVALFADSPTTIRNVYNWRVKETERMKAIVTELTKLGAEVKEGRDYLVVNPIKNKFNENRNDIETKGTLKSGVAIDTYDDHRMAMCFSLVACGDVDVIINDPKCTRKTFPTYFDELAKMSQSK